MRASAAKQAEQTDSACLLWPAERFYWAVIDGPDRNATGSARGWHRAGGGWGGGALPAGLWPDLADHLPVPVDGLHAVCVSGSDGGLVVCAIESATLRDEVPGHILRLSPVEWPVAVEALAPVQELNLLTGPFEPRPLRRARAARHLSAMAFVAVLAGLVSAGLGRRAEHATLLAASAKEESERLLATASPGATTAKDLAQELERARTVAGVDLGTRRSPDASLALASLLAVWPKTDDLRSKPQSISVAQDGITLSVVVQGDSAPFLNALKPPPGWSMDEPRLTAVDSQTRLSLRFNRVRGQGGSP